MELLYFVDRTITRAIIALSGLLKRKLKISVYTQAMLMQLIGMLTMLILAFGSPPTPSLSIALLLGSLVVCIAAVMLFDRTASKLAYYLAVCLVYLHYYFDQAGLRREDRRFSYGHYAWGWVIIWGMFIGWYCLNTVDWITPFLLCIVYMVAPRQTYLTFAMRTPHNSGKKDSLVMSEAMQKLLDRCRSWLPSPQPAGA